MCSTNVIRRRFWIEDWLEELFANISKQRLRHVIFHFHCNSINKWTPCFFSLKVMQCQGSYGNLHEIFMRLVVSCKVADGIKPVISYKTRFNVKTTAKSFIALVALKCDDHLYQFRNFNSFCVERMLCSNYFFKCLLWIRWRTWVGQWIKQATTNASVDWSWSQYSRTEDVSKSFKI